MLQGYYKQLLETWAVVENFLKLETPSLDISEHQR